MLPSELAPSNDGAAVAFAFGRLCSHLFRLNYTFRRRRVLPATLLPATTSQMLTEECSDFPPPADIRKGAAGSDYSM